MSASPATVAIDDVQGHHPEEEGVKKGVAAADADEALKVIQSFSEGDIVEIDAATNKRLLRIIDTKLLPMSKCTTYYWVPWETLLTSE